MTGWFAGSLKAVAISAAAAALMSVAVNLVLPRVNAIPSAARRADAAFLLGLLPMAVALMGWAGLG